jgi:hypothetical protein
MIDMVKKSDAYNEGYDAQQDGLSEDDNPYPAGCQQCLDWDEGFEQSEFENSGDEEIEEDDDDDTDTNDAV